MAHGPLRQKLNNVLHPVFGKPDPLFVADDPTLAQWLTSEGLRVCLFHELSHTTKQQRRNVVLLPTKTAGLSYFQLEKNFKSSRLLIIPLVAFDPSFDAAKYTLYTLAASDFVGSTKANLDWISRLGDSSLREIHFRGQIGELEVVLKERLDLMLPATQAQLLPGEWEAIGMFFEIAMIPDNEDFFHPGYVVNGEIDVTGVAIAHHRVMPEQLTHLPKEAWELLGSLIRTGRFPLRVRVENSQLISARTRDGFEITDALRRFSNPQLELMLVEMAISNNTGLDAGMIDWGVNSVMNEGVGGIHFAVGDGVTGAHIDFICPGMEATLIKGGQR